MKELIPVGYRFVFVSFCQFSRLYRRGTTVCLSIFRKSLSMALHFTCLANLYMRPWCQTVSYAAERSTNTAPVFNLFSNPDSMQEVRASTCSVVSRCVLKPACSGGMCRLKIGRSRDNSILSSSLQLQQRRAMGQQFSELYAAFPGFSRAIIFACVHAVGRFLFSIISEKAVANQVFACGPKWVSMSGYTPSMPAAFPFFICFRASSSFQTLTFPVSSVFPGQVWRIRWYCFLMFVSNLVFGFLTLFCLISLAMSSAVIGGFLGGLLAFCGSSRHSMRVCWSVGSPSFQWSPSTSPFFPAPAKQGDRQQLQDLESVRTPPAAHCSFSTNMECIFSIASGNVFCCPSY